MFSLTSENGISENVDADKMNEAYDLIDNLGNCFIHIGYSACSIILVTINGNVIFS